MACGCGQIPGVDFVDVFSPVINGVKFRVAMFKMVINKDTAKMFDVETSFLRGELKELSNMDCLKGMESKSEECVLLEKLVYDLVEASLCYTRKFRKVLEDMGFEMCPSDPCLFLRETGAYKLIILTYMDDNLCIEKMKAIDAFLEEFKSSFEVLRKGRKAWIGQPHMIKERRKTFREEVKNMKKYKTPDTPCFRDEDPLVDDDLQRRNRTGVGQVMFLIKHSRPDLMIAVRELSKVLGKATPAV